jgi:ferredoxin-nitrate reductase
LNKIKEGCKDHLQLCQLTGAGMGCGSCRPEIKAILDAQVNVLKKENEVVTM